MENIDDSGPLTSTALNFSYTTHPHPNATPRPNSTPAIPETAPHTPTNTNTSNRENSTQEPTLIPSDERPDTRATTQDARTDLPDATPPRSRHPRVDPPDPTRERRTRSGRVVRFPSKYKDFV
ncbi:unnamed protein product, partial [Nesidiocoris tenuis]